MLTNQFFYRKYGVRLAQQLITPNTFALATLELPVKSIYHYITYDGVEYGPPTDDFIFRNVKKPIYVGHITDLPVGSNLGNPRKQTINTTTLIRDYHNSNRRFKLLRNISLIAKDPYTLITYNYCLIQKQYKYIRSFFTEYYKWKNTFSAICLNIDTITKEYDHNHYLVINTPKVLPSLQQLLLASKIDMTQSLMKVFNTNNSFILLEILKYISFNKTDSLFSKIADNKIHLVNFIYQENGKWCVLNLGYLNSFKKNTDAENFVITPSANLDELQLQKRLLKFNMSVMQLRTVTADRFQDDTDEKKESILSGNIIDDDDDGPQELKDTVEETEVLKEEDIKDDAVSDISDLSEDELKKLYEQEDLKLDEELQYLNDIAAKKEIEVETEEVNINDVIDEQEKDLGDYIVDTCDKLADDGLISAAEFKRYKNLAGSYRQLLSPDGKTTIEEYIKIDPQSLIIKESPNMPDSNQVIDKTMLKSSLIDFDSKYITNILSKDITNAVMSVQKAGIAVTGYRVEEVDDILGAYENHTLKIAPIEGAQSVLHFKLPKIDTNGTFQSNGTRYSLRKMRGDLPIRKTNYNKVALTSYYGKAFVNRSKKKANDYTYWLQTEIMRIGLDKEDLSITNIIPSNVHDGSLKLPRSYSSASMSFKSFVSRGYTLNFDRKEVLKTYPEHVLKQFETSGSIVIGTNNNSQYLIMDKNNSVYTTNGDTVELLSSFEEFLNLPLSEVPVDYCDIVVYGKEVPMGVVLGYKLGLDNLMKILNVNPRRVQAGSRINLQDNEYAIYFSDETLIFTRDNELASLILSSFNQYHRVIRQFSVYSFDKKGVYLNLLDSAQLGVRYLREIDLMFNMFVDPITRDILIEMKEPVTFQGLLFRSCQMLCTDDYPDELDPKYMRIKGYERLSGAVYTELVQAIRTHSGKLGKKNQKIELNPYAIWRRISEDPSKGQISEINPVKALKEMEAVTYAGSGGRNKRSMTASTRSYHKNDMGTISESTVDSSDVAINIFTSADPRFKSLRGTSHDYDFKRDGATSLMSTSALLAPGSNRDD